MGESHRESMGELCFEQVSMGNCVLELGGFESVGWRSSEWDSSADPDQELHFGCDVWKVEDEKAVWFKCPSVVKVEGLLAGGTRLGRCKSIGGDLSS